MINLNQVERVFNRVKETLNTDVLVAGGSIRDYLSNKKTYKDLDIFIRTDELLHFQEQCNKLSKYYGLSQSLSNKQLETPDYRNNPAIVEVVNFKIRFGMDLQLVGVRNAGVNFPKGVFSSFDFNINCCGYNETGIVDTPEAKMDRLTKTFTIRNVYSGHQLVRLIDKYKRLTETKYPNFKLAYTQGAFHDHNP